MMQIYPNIFLIQLTKTKLKTTQITMQSKSNSRQFESIEQQKHWTIASKQFDPYTQYNGTLSPLIKYDCRHIHMHCKIEGWHASSFKKARNGPANVEIGLV
jgi:hypothetical protein